MDAQDQQDYWNNVSLRPGAARHNHNICKYVRPLEAAVATLKLFFVIAKRRSRCGDPKIVFWSLRSRVTAPFANFPLMARYPAGSGCGNPVYKTELSFPGFMSRIATATRGGLAMTRQKGRLYTRDCRDHAIGV
jgi:hypothetical protein